MSISDSLFLPFIPNRLKVTQSDSRSTQSVSATQKITKEVKGIIILERLCLTDCENSNQPRASTVEALKDLKWCLLIDSIATGYLQQNISH